MPNFNDAAIAMILDKAVSHAMALGRFDFVNQHEPKGGSPGTDIMCAVWVDRIRPAKTSGLSSTSGVLTLMHRIYQNMLKQPYDQIDPIVLAATSVLIGAFSGDFDFGGVSNTRAVDLLGSEGVPLSGQAGYVDVGGKRFRVMTVTVPIIVNDMWTQAG